MSKRRKQPSPPPSDRPAVQKDATEKKPSFELRYTPDAGTDIKGLDGSVRKHLRKVLETKLAVDPESYGLPLRGSLTNYWKHEFAGHRVIYRIYPAQGIVAVCAVGPRKGGDAEDIYRKLDAVIKTGRLAEQVASVLSDILPKNPKEK
jgi:mRNA-degrading endonuclease RelE of RelBE toxin-antitoxin system